MLLCCLSIARLHLRTIKDIRRQCTTNTPSDKTAPPGFCQRQVCLGSTYEEADAICVSVMPYPHIMAADITTSFCRPDVLTKSSHNCGECDGQWVEDNVRTYVGVCLPKRKKRTNTDRTTAAGRMSRWLKGPRSLTGCFRCVS